MSRTLFDQVLVAPARRRSRSWVTIGSIVLHGVGLMLLFVWPLTAAFRVPDIQTPLAPLMLAAAVAPPPVEVAAPRESTSEVVVDAAPIVAPDSITPEVPRPDTSGVPPVPGGLPGVAGSTGFTGLLSDRHVPRPFTTPPPPATPPAPVRVGGNVDAPVRTYYKAPAYPPLAQSARVEGMVILEATIDANGLVQDVKVLRSIALLDQAAIDAVRQWRYTPTRLNGQSIAVIMTVTVVFSLK